MKQWIKGLGDKAREAGKNALEAEKKRWAEAPLTDEEKAVFARYQTVSAFIPEAISSQMIKVPKEIGMRNRLDIRNAINQPDFLKILDDAERAKQEAAALEAKRQAEEKARIAAEKAQKKKDALAAIDAFYENELNSVEIATRNVAQGIGIREMGQLADQFHEKRTGSPKKSSNAGSIGMIFDAAAEGYSSGKFQTGLNNTLIKRTLGDIKEQHRAILRVADVLFELGHLSRDELYSVKMPIVWNEGQCEIVVPSEVSNAKDKFVFQDILKMVITSKFGVASVGVDVVSKKCRELLGSDLDTSEQEFIKRYLYRGAKWLNGDSADALIPNGMSDKVLRLGTFEDGRELFYGRNESLITIAPPGTGKSTAHVMRNLLYLNAPAVVLDIKGDMQAATSDWRAANVGQVYKFAPNDRENSLHFNPLDFVSTDPDDAFEESERLAELLTVPAEEGEYFDERAIQVIRAMVLYVALARSGEERCMETVLDLLSGVNTDPLAQERGPDDEDAPFDALISDLMMHEMPTLRRMGNALNKMPQKQREGVFDTARSKLKVWESPAIARLTRDTTFRPEFLRSERATLYLSVDLGDIKRFASVLRVLLGSCVSNLCKGTPDPDAETVTFFLDELPRLKRMDVIEEALDVGRGFGVRLWMFAQNIGQLKTSYPNAEGMVGNCLAQCYMNPDAERSKWLSGHLGIRRGLLDGNEKPLVEAFELTGSAFSDKIVVMLNGMDNAVLTKQPYYADKEALSRANKS